MWSFISTELFWLLASITTLLALVYKPVREMILKTVDDKIIKIEKDLEEAHRLKSEAYEHLMVTRDHYQESLDRYQDLLVKAREEAELIIDQAKLRVMDVASKGESLLKEYEQQQMHRTIETFKQEVIVSVLSIVETELLDKMSYKDQMSVIESNRRTFKKIWN